MAIWQLATRTFCFAYFSPQSNCLELLSVLVPILALPRLPSAKRRLTPSKRPSAGASPASSQPRAVLPLAVHCPKMNSITFINALLVDKPESTYTVVITNGRVTSISPSTAPTLSAGGEVVDLRGEQYLGLSLVDAHTHFTAWTLNRTRVDLSKARSARDAIELMKDAAARDEGGSTTPLVGRDL